MRLCVLLVATCLVASGHCRSERSWSSKYFTTRPPPSDDVQIFIHVHCAKHWASILEEQLHAIVWSGLMERVSAIHVVINKMNMTKALGEADNLTRIYGPKINTTFHFNDTTYERLTQYSIRQHITPRTRFLYMHSKGVTHSVQDLHIRYWRQYMEYFLIRHWETCLCMLDSGKFDTVGVNLRQKPKWLWAPHYNGNFWWTTGEWWLSLNKVIGRLYWGPENHLLANLADPLHQPRAALIAESERINADPYLASIKPKHYSMISNWTMAASVGCHPRLAEPQAARRLKA